MIMNTINLPIYFTSLCNKELYLDKETDCKDKGINMILRIKSQVNTLHRQKILSSLHLQFSV